MTGSLFDDVPREELVAALTTLGVRNRIQFDALVSGRIPRVREWFRDDPTDPRHGTTNGYRNLGCRCDRCRRANAQAHISYMDANPIQRARHRVREMGRYDQRTNHGRN